MILAQGRECAPQPVVTERTVRPQGHLSQALPSAAVERPGLGPVLSLLDTPAESLRADQLPRPALTSHAGRPLKPVLNNRTVFEAGEPVIDSDIKRNVAAFVVLATRIKQAK